MDEGEIVTAAVMVGNRVLTEGVSLKDNKYITYIRSMEQLTKTVLHSEDSDDPNELTFLSANKDYIVSIDIVNKLLKVFLFTTKEHLYDIQLTDMKKPYGVCLIGNVVLIADIQGGAVSKYCLSSSRADLIWTCTGLTYPSGVTTDKSGFMYVAGLHSPYIHIISPDGE